MEHDGFLTLDTIFLFDLGSPVKGLLVAVVPDNYVGTSFSKALGHCKANASACSRNDGGPPFEREQRQDLGLSGGGSIVVGKVAAFHC